jgi:hypothetical protein
MLLATRIPLESPRRTPVFSRVVRGRLGSPRVGAHRVRGVGQSELPAEVGAIGGVFAGASTALIQTGVLSTAGATGGFLAAAIPIIGPAIAGVTIGLSLLFNRKGPQQKVATTQIVNQLEPLLQKNLQGYLNGPRNRSSQQQALANFDAAWQWLIQHCRIPVMGEPGQRCVTDRQAGSCVWREAGQCWNWFVGYRDPIANDPKVQDDSAAAVASDLASSVSSSVASALSGQSGYGWLLIPAAVGAAWWALS